MLIPPEFHQDFDKKEKQKQKLTISVQFNGLKSQMIMNSNSKIKKLLKILKNDNTDEEIKTYIKEKLSTKNILEHLQKQYKHSSKETKNIIKSLDQSQILKEVEVEMHIAISLKNFKKNAKQTEKNAKQNEKDGKQNEKNANNLIEQKIEAEKQSFGLSSSNTQRLTLSQKLSQMLNILHKKRSQLEVEIDNENRILRKSSNCEIDLKFWNCEEIQLSKSKSQGAKIMKQYQFQNRKDVEQFIQQNKRSAGQIHKKMQIFIDSIELQVYSQRIEKEDIIKKEQNKNFKIKIQKIDKLIHNYIECLQNYFVCLSSIFKEYVVFGENEKQEH